eukprot:5939802-Amphidinium_carterae.2
MNRVRSLGLPAPTRIAKSLNSVGLYGAEVGVGNTVRVHMGVRDCCDPLLCSSCRTNSSGKDLGIKRLRPFHKQ